MILLRPVDRHAADERMIYAETRTLVDQARTRFAKKWRLRCPAVVECLEEAGDDLFTFLRFPKLQWKALRMHWSASMENSAVVRKRRRASLGRMLSSCCFLVCCAADK